VDHSIIMGSDYFETDETVRNNLEQGLPAIGIGNNCEIRNCIIDKNARIGHGVKLANSRGISEEHTKNYSIVDQVVVIPKNAVIADGSVI
jgi:glucose-1-phosphate adenylyltransferase